MRIIAGSARGRKLLSVPKDSGVRPISGRIKQSLFDIIRPRLPGSRFLDLFAGTGAVGMEALSRLAEAAVFVEREKLCVSVIERNLVRAGWATKARVLRASALGPLSWIPFRSGTSRFDLIFMGPPYKDRDKRPLFYCRSVLESVAVSGILADDGWVVAQHHQKEDPAAPAGLERFRVERYGDSRLSFYRKPSPPAA
ncbi:MAG: 16S rRNA (guanine(966)-N(2))-methyltransferase RsmD [Elusimicrobiota bacterium]